MEYRKCSEHLLIVMNSRIEIHLIVVCKGHKDIWNSADNNKTRLAIRCRRYRIFRCYHCKKLQKRYNGEYPLYHFLYLFLYHFLYGAVGRDHIK